ncbi:response regulator [Burkholderia cenocepacia]|uniref:ATP-binding protein n=1 Tax=Burkholderia cepacia complex TaxID=87882 RepID=UPI0015E46006|nr:MULTISPECIES: ATP-binding protein [Burkholderia cepacia complex]MBR8383926.1 response regulator [Burkholderia cenocepacia]MBR8434909.1 response regulator [Burkholderia cenocepacia]
MHRISDAYQRTILYSGAAMLTVAILIAIAVSVSARIDRFIDDQRSLFVHQRNNVQAAVQLAESHLQGLVLQHGGRESWGINANATHALLDKYAGKLARHHGVTLTDKDLSASPYTLVSIDPDYFRMHGSRIVSLLNTASPTPGVQAVAKGIEKGNFVLDADARVFAFHPAFDASTALADRPREDALALARAETADIRNALAKRPDLIAWTNPRRSPLTGEQTIQYGAFTERDHKPVAVLGYDIKLADFPSFFLDDHPVTQGFSLLSRDGTTVMAGHPDNDHTILDTAQLAAADIPFATLAPPKINRTQDGFLIAQRIRGPGWIAVYAFDRSTILHGLRSELTVIVLGATAVLILFWGFVLTFDKSVLIPMRRKMRRVYESEAFNRTIVRMAPIGLSVLDARTHEIVLQNAIASTLLAGSPDAARTFYRTLTKACDEPRLAHQLAKGAIMRSEIAVDASNGKPVTIGATFVATRYDERDVILCGLVDVSRDREMQQQLLAAKCDAEAANHAKSMFLATMSHEIRTPLHAALGNLELLSMHALTTPQHMLVDTIGKSFGALRRLLNDVLDFSKIEAGELRLESVAFDPAELAETCAQAIAPSLAAKGVQLQLLTDASLPARVVADSSRLQQIIMNLLDNAAKFTAAGRVALAMTLLQAGRRSLLRVHVIDSGIGMSAHEQTRLFQPFAQVGESTGRRFGGTGLGLSLCKRLTRLMDGNIRVASAPGAGSTFTVEIPVAAPTAPTTVQRGTPSLDGLSVLLCCDDDAWREALLARLASWGIAAETVTMAALPDADLHERILLDARSGSDLADTDRQSAQIALDRGLMGIVRLSDTYPLAPEPRDGGIAASSLSRAALRAALATAAGVAAPLVYRPTIRGMARARRARLLIVEDDDVARTLLLTQLGILGCHEVDDVPDGVAAIDCCRHHHYDLILTDLNMPDMCGTEMLTRLRQIDIATPVVLVSASVPIAGGAHAGRDGFAAIVEKPLSIEQLAALLDRLLPADQLDRARRAAHVVDKTATARTATLEKDLWETFAACWPADRAVVQAKAAAKDVDAFLRRIHKIKGALRVLQDDALADLLGEIEQVARIEGLDAAMPLWVRAEAALTSRVDTL